MLRSVGFGSKQTLILLLALLLSSHVALGKSHDSESSFHILKWGDSTSLRHRAWQNPHQQRLKEGMSSCNKCSIYRRHNSHCRSMPILPSARGQCPRALPSGMPVGPILTCPEECWETCLGTYVSPEGTVPGRPYRCCQLGKGILVSIRARDWQVGLGYSWWKDPHGGDPRDQGLG